MMYINLLLSRLNESSPQTQETRKLHSEYLPMKMLFISFLQIIPNMFHTASIWLTLGLAVQRYIYVCHPDYAPYVCTLPKVYTCLGCILLSAVLHQSTRVFDRDYLQVRKTQTSLFERSCNTGPNFTHVPKT